MHRIALLLGTGATCLLVTTACGDSGPKQQFAEPVDSFATDLAQDMEEEEESGYVKAFEAKEPEADEMAPEGAEDAGETVEMAEMKVDG